MVYFNRLPGVIIPFPFLNQGVVTYISPVEAFATTIKISDQQSVLDQSLLSSSWWFKGQIGSHTLLVTLMHSHSVPKNAWLHFDHGCKHFNRGQVSDYIPLMRICLHNTYIVSQSLASRSYEISTYLLHVSNGPVSGR